jgi:hypothetical protein
MILPELNYVKWYLGLNLQCFGSFLLYLLGIFAIFFIMNAILI